MNFANIFERNDPTINAIIPERTIAPRITMRWDKVISFRICSTATAVPERVLFIEYSVTKLNPIITVLDAPVRKRKPFLSSGTNSELNKAECPEPMPGRKENKGVNSEAKIAFNVSFLVIFICSIFNIF